MGQTLSRILQYDGFWLLIYFRYRRQEREAARDPFRVEAQYLDLEREVQHNAEVEDGQKSAAKHPRSEAHLEKNPLDLWNRVIVTKESFAGAPVVMKKGHVMQLYADIYLKNTVCRLDSGQGVLSIVLDQVDLQVKSSCEAGCCKCRTWTPLVLNKFSIKLVPELVNRCHRVQMEPYLDSETFGLQKTSSITLQAGHPNQIAVRYNNGESISRGAPAFGWEPAQREDGNDGVTFIWVQHRYKEGEKIETDTLKFGPIPQLAIQSKFIHMHPASFVAKGSWECHPQEELEKVVVDMEVTFYPLLQKIYSILGYRNVVLPPQRISQILRF